eukprot:TRINITY_DN62627_c0_g1_i1.p1 TRINITY_DN62627_c0_g1~~TRINITY_DN62627_c0_g1_i1.p1  ORF type:complete len:479 (+),score=97.02 TRINITY_DN62627_c0_g1_i1:118-1437(+)
MVRDIEKIHLSGLTVDVLTRIFDIRSDLGLAHRQEACKVIGSTEAGRTCRTNRKRYSAVFEIGLDLSKEYTDFGSPFHWISDCTWAQSFEVAKGGGDDVAGSVSDGKVIVWDDDWLKRGEIALLSPCGNDDVGVDAGTAEQKRASESQQEHASIADFLDDLDSSDEENVFQQGSEQAGSEVPRDTDAVPRDAALDAGKDAQVGCASRKENRGATIEAGRLRSSFVASDNEDEDEVVRGYLHKREGFDDSVSEALGKAQGGLLDAALGAAFAGAEVGLKAMRGGWVKRFFQVQMDMRHNRSLCWYKQMGDLVALGCLLFSDMGQITSTEAKGAKHYSIMIEVVNVAGILVETLELRTKFAGERDMWMSKLKSFKEKANVRENMVSDRTKTVWLLEDHLRLKDTEYAEHKKTFVGAIKKCKALLKVGWKKTSPSQKSAAGS